MLSQPIVKYLQLLRVKQWYKNLLVFLAIIFSGSLFIEAAWISAGIAFTAFCALASSSYIINDIADRKRDALNPEKASRPIASGSVSVPAAFLFAGITALLGLWLASLLSRSAFFIAISYFVLCQIYTFWLKHEPFADVLTIAVNFVLRAVAGAAAIGVMASSWLITGIFFLALFLILEKRRGELMLMGKHATRTRESLKGYTLALLDRLSMTATACLIISYALFVFFGSHAGLYITLPIALYAIFRYEKLAGEGNIIARHPEKVFTDGRMVASMVLWLVLTLLVLY